MAALEMHPSEFAYAFAYAKTEEIIGWGSAPFSPPPDDGSSTSDWLTAGEARLVAAGRLVDAPNKGLSFAEAITADILALVDPSLVLMAERKDGDLVKRLTVHVAGSELVGLTRRPDGMFELTRYSEITAAAGACAGFLGASFDRLDAEARIDTDLKTLTTLYKSSKTKADESAKALVLLGLTEKEAASAISAFREPATAGVLSTLYCAGNKVRDADPITVMTTPQDETWIMFQPASIAGPMILERSSVGALTARITVGITARLSAAE